jgi:hypothetical protein
MGRNGQDQYSTGMISSTINLIIFIHYLDNINE